MKYKPKQFRICEETKKLVYLLHSKLYDPDIPSHLLFQPIIDEGLREIKRRNYALHDVNFRKFLKHKQRLPERFLLTEDTCEEFASVMASLIEYHKHHIYEYQVAEYILLRHYEKHYMESCNEEIDKFVNSNLTPI